MKIIKAFWSQQIYKLHLTKIYSDDGKSCGDFLRYLSIVIAPFKKTG